MTTIKTWQERTGTHAIGTPLVRGLVEDKKAMQAEITELRAAVERKDALLRKCLTVIWLDADGLKVRVQIKKELS